MDDLDPAALVARSVDTIATVRDVARAHGDDEPVRRGIETLDDALDALAAAEHYLRGRPPRTEVLTVHVQVESLRIAIGDARVRRRTATTGELHRSLGRLRGGMGTAELLREIPHELGRLGYSRSLVSDLRGVVWRARSAFAHQDEAFAEALIKVGSALPGRIGREEPETEAVRLRTSVLVRNAQRRPNVHRELVQLGDTRDYAVAPVMVHGRAIALVHVDRHEQLDVVDDADRDLLGLFADGIGLALERARYQERLALLRRQFELQVASIDDAFYGMPERDDAAQAPLSQLTAGPLDELTRRELEVLRHLAGGAANQAIAERLGISEGTVKTHVKGVLRKLGAANRADAAARFHALGRG